MKPILMLLLFLVSIEYTMGFDSIAIFNDEVCFLIQNVNPHCVSADDVYKAKQDILKDAYRIMQSSSTHICTEEWDNILCAGSNEHGQLGVSLDTKFVSVDDADWDDKISISGILELRLSEGNTCVFSSEGVSDESKKIWCWGDNSNGQLSEDTVVASTTPVQLPFTNVDYHFDVGKGFVCAATKNDANLIACVGKNDENQHGLPNDSNIGINEYFDSNNITVTDVRKVVTGDGFGCVVLYERELLCWGKNRNGMLLSGNEFDVYEAYEFQNRSIVDIQVSENNACYILRNQNNGDKPEIYCTGTNKYGQLGQGLGVSETLTLPEALERGPIPLNYDGYGVGKLTMSNERVCYGRTSGRNVYLYCWGLSLDRKENIGDEPNEISNLKSFEGLPDIPQEGDNMFLVLYFIGFGIFGGVCVIAIGVYCCWRWKRRNSNEVIVTQTEKL